VTIINFNDKARVIYERQKPNKINVEQITFSRGDTNFSEAFKMGYEIINEYVRDDKIVIMFMTDGQSRYP
jgi:Mg-chelatase subunit ChlD